jgi:hypothetical protein
MHPMSITLYIKQFIIRNFLNKETRYKYLFDHHFFVNQYFLHKSASLDNMAKILNIKMEQVNQISLSNYGVEFEVLCSEYKFKHFWEEFTNPLNSELPVDSIIKSAGFISNDDFSESILKHKEESKYILEKKFT